MSWRPPGASPLSSDLSALSLWPMIWQHYICRPTIVIIFVDYFRSFRALTPTLPVTCICDLRPKNGMEPFTSYEQSVAYLSLELSGESRSTNLQNPTKRTNTQCVTYDEVSDDHRQEEKRNAVETAAKHAIPRGLDPLAAQQNMQSHVDSIHSPHSTRNTIMNEWR